MANKHAEPDLDFLVADPEALASALLRVGVEIDERKLNGPRASSLYDACVRESQLARLVGKRKHDRRLDFRSRLVFGIGDGVHSWLQNSSVMFGDDRVGLWECRACGHVSKFGPPVQEDCSQCGASPRARVYQEYEFKCPPFPVGGHPDMFLQRGPLVRICEFKTIDGDVFHESLEAPLIAHVWQITVYLWLCGLSKRLQKYVDPNIGYIFYFAKKQKKDSFPVKCFRVIKQEDLLKEIRTKVALFGQTELAAVRVDCEHSEWRNWRARQCPVSDSCKEELRG
jgi:hypothetical protein